MRIKISDLMDYYEAEAYPMDDPHIVSADRITELTMQKLGLDTPGPEEPEVTSVKTGRRFLRTLLFAAAISLTMAVAAFAIYRYTLKDAAIENVPTRESEMYDWRAGETETLLSLNGFSDSPEYQAYVEWLDWNRAWRAEHPDPWKELGVDDSYFETPNNYLYYDAWFAEQGEALDAIAAKYGLTLLDGRHFIRTETQLCRALGLESILADGYDVYDGCFFDKGTFNAYGRTSIDGRSIDFTVWNAVKGSFIPLSDVIPEDYRSWSYTTKDGFEVIFMTDTLRGRTAMIAPLSGSFVTASVRTDDTQAAEAFAEAIDLHALDELFSTASARAAVEKSIAEYVASLSFVTAIDELSEDEQAVLDYLGDWYLGELPEGAELYAMQIAAPDHYDDFYLVSRRYEGPGFEGALSYRELNPLDGENEQTRLQLSTYSLYYEDPSNPYWICTPCTVSGYEAMLSDPDRTGNTLILTWLDTDRQLLFRLEMSGVSEEELISLAESVTGTAPETPPVRLASSTEERFTFSLMPLGEMQMYGGEPVESSVETKRVLAELGNYGLTELPEDTGDPVVTGQRAYMYEYYWDGRADWNEAWKTYRFDPLLGVNGLQLVYRRFDDGRTSEAYEIDKRYDEYFADVSDVTVGGDPGYIASGDFYADQVFIEWYDAQRDLIFKLQVAVKAYPDMTEDELIALAESVAEQPWTGTERGLSEYVYAGADSASAEMGAWKLPGAAYGSVAMIESMKTEDWQDAPFWFVEDSPYVSEFVTVTYADGLALGWQRTWSDPERTTENGADSFAAITKYLLACDDSGAVQTGLTVNGQDAVLIRYPWQDFYKEAVTQLMWYDADAGLIFSLADFPGEDGTPRTAEQLIALAESVTMQ